MYDGSSESAERTSLVHYDLVITGGEVFDPARLTFVRQDVAIACGMVARIAPRLDLNGATRVVDAAGSIVTPGLIDAHIHAFPWGHLVGVNVDPLSSRSGVTTFIDGGSTGALNFLAFRKFVIERARSNIFALLNVSAVGQTVDAIRGLEFYENDDLRLLHLPSAIETVDGNRDIIVGVKVRLYNYNGPTSLVPLLVARQLADEVGLPLMVHSMWPLPFTEVLRHLKPGDIVTHLYHPGPGAIIGRDGQVRPEYREARARGVLFDSGSAKMLNSFPIVRTALDQGFDPDMISTDLTTKAIGEFTIDLPNTLSKFLALGLGLEEVLAKVTAAPRRLLPSQCACGQLAEGMPADLAVYAVEDGDFNYVDWSGQTLRANKRIVNTLTVKDGVVLSPEPQPQMQLGFVKR